MKNTGRKLWYSITNPDRVAVLDYAVKPAPLYEPQTKPHQQLFKIISAGNAAYESLLNNCLSHQIAFQKISLSTSGPKLPAWQNGFLPAIDTIMLYTILQKFQPKKYIEIGSGNSTKLAAFCKEQENLKFSITSIDPNPRREIKELADTWIDQQIQSVPVGLFKNLEENDIVFMDGSHVLHANSDVMWFFMEILPIIPKGVLIHIHDIFLPYDYPQWVCDRFFSEQYIFATCLLNSDRYKIISPNYYILTEKIGENIWNELWKLPALSGVKKHGRSFWFTKV